MPPTTKPRACAHIDRPIRAKGLCANCYATASYARNGKRNAGARAKKRSLAEAAAPIRSRLMRTALVLTQNRADAEDVVQNTFVQACRKIADWRGEAALETWLVAICRNESLMWRRRTHHTNMKSPPKFIYLDHLEPAALRRIEREVSLG